MSGTESTIVRITIGVAFATVAIAAAAAIVRWTAPTRTPIGPESVAPSASSSVGASIGAACPAKEVDARRRSDHGRAMQVADAGSVPGAFDHATFGRTQPVAREGKAEAAPDPAMTLRAPGRGNARHAATLRPPDRRGP